MNLRHTFRLMTRTFRLFSAYLANNGIQRKVQPRFLHFGTAVVLTLCVWGHVSELVDHWDNTFRTGNDVEYSTVIVALVIGAVICFAGLATVVTRSRTAIVCKFSLLAVRVAAADSTPSFIAHSPPLPLRI